MFIDRMPEMTFFENADRTPGEEDNLEAQRASETDQTSQVENLFQQSPLYLALFNGAEQRLAISNAAFQRLFTLKNGESIDTYSRTSSSRIFLQPLQDVYRTGTPVTLYEVPLQPDTQLMGEQKTAYFTFLYSPQRDTTGQITGVILQGFEVTEQVLARQRATFEKNWRTIVEVLPEKVFTARADGVVDYCNQAWLNATGLSMEQLLEQNLINALHPDEAANYQNCWQQAIQTGEPFIIEHRLREANGIYRWHLSQARRFEDRTSGVSMWIGTSSDIDDMKQASIRKDEFMSLASHELKTPVTSMKGFAYLLQRRLPANSDPQIKLFLTRIDIQLTRLTQLINDLLDLSRFQTGSFGYQEELLDLDGLVQQTIKQIQATTSTHQLELVGETAAHVLGDRERLKQVFEHLLSNAIKYSPSAQTVVITLSRSGNEALISFKDQGIGIETEHQKRIFELFYQVPKTLEKTTPGLGIGLYLSAQIVQRHNGEIRVESAEGQGSTFYVNLPVAADTE